MHTTNPLQIDKIIQAIYLKMEVTILEEKEKTPTKIIKYDNSLLEVEHNLEPQQKRFLYVNHNNFDMALECQVVEQNSQGAEVLRPLQLRASERIRKEDRFAVSHDKDGVNQVSALVQTSSVFSSLSGMNSKRDNIIKLYIKAITERIPSPGRIEVVLRKTKRLDHKLRLIDKFKRSIFAPNRHQVNSMMQIDLGKFLGPREYKELAQHEHGDRNMLSEICEPLWMRGIMLFGYLQIYSSDTMTEEHYNIVEKLARRLEQDFVRHGCLPHSSEVCELEDVSPHGLSFIYPHRSGTGSSFMPGDDIIFDLCFEPPRKMSMEGTVKNIKSLENSYRFGIQLRDMSPEQSEFVQSYINGQQTSA